MARPITFLYRPMGRPAAGNAGRKGQSWLRRPRTVLQRRSFRGRQGAGRSGLLQRQRQTLDRYGLQVFSISNHLVGPGHFGPVDLRHKAILPAHVWGDGDPAGVSARAAEEMKNTARAAKKLGLKSSTALRDRASGTCFIRSRRSRRRRSTPASSCWRSGFTRSSTCSPSAA